ncbi:MAG: 3'-5' exonuclease [Bacteroidales bacterium]
MEKTQKYNFRKSLTDEELHEYDVSCFKGKIVVIDDIEKFRMVMPELRKERILGFDTETRPSFRKGHRNNVSLLQLSAKDKAILFRLNRIGLPRELTALLSDPSVIKAGVAIHDDIRVLMNKRKFNPEGFIDLQSFVRNFGIQSSGLRKLSAIVLGFRISKRQQVTDWEAGNLSEAQQVYAATDAWVCYEIYNALSAIN